MAERDDHPEIDPVDDVIDAGVEPTDEVQADVDLQRRIDAVLRGALAPPEDVVDAPSLLVDRAIDDHIDCRHALPDDDEVGLQARIDDAVRRQMSPDESRLAIRRARRIPVLSIAAAIFVVIGAAALLMLLRQGEDDLTKLYVAHVESGFIQFACETPEQFQDWMEDNFEHAIRPEPVGDDLTFRGWNYDSPISQYTGVMLGRARGEDVIVLVDHIDRDVDLTAPARGLSLFRQTLGDLVFYELTPLDEPVFLPSFKLVD